MELRPLGFGEIFDRAVTLYIRNFVAFAGIVLVMIVPFAVFEYVMAVASQPEFDAFIHVFTHPHDPQPPPPVAFTSPAWIAGIAGVALIFLCIWPFVCSAVVVGVARVYGGLPIEFRACYAAVLARWKQIAGLTFVQAIAVIAWYLATVLLLVVIFVPIVTMGAALPRVALVAAVIVAIAAFFAAFALLAVLIVATSFATYSSVIERRDVFDALRTGFSRVFNRSEFWRALLFSIAASAVVTGASMSLGVIGLAATLLHLPALRAAIDSISEAVLAPFGVVLFAVYYFDVRIRHEAFDLEASLDRLAGSQTT